VPIVIVTAAEHARARAEQIGADDAIAKPFEVSILLQVVARHLRAEGQRA
jgi:DNA-binding response OmpR family regulator